MLDTRDSIGRAVATYSAILWTPMLSEVDLNLGQVDCEKDLVVGVLRREGSFCCGRRIDLGSDVDVRVLKNGESGRLATTTELYTDGLARGADDEVLIMQMEGARSVERIRERAS